MGRLPNFGRLVVLTRASGSRSSDQSRLRGEGDIGRKEAVERPYRLFRDQVGSLGDQGIAAQRGVKAELRHQLDRFIRIAIALVVEGDRAGLRDERGILRLDSGWRCRGLQMGGW